MTSTAPRRAMPLLDALQVIRDLRREQIVVTTMGSAREWPKLSQSPLDFHYLPSAMGHAPVLGLGLALAQPAREVIAFNGDGGMLMGLGGLATIVASGVTNLTVIVLDNGLYEVTGGQPTAGAVCQINFGQIAMAAGFNNVARFDDLANWQQRAAQVLQQAGPRFITLSVAPVGPAFHLPVPENMTARITRFRQTLGVAGA